MTVTLHEYLDDWIEILGPRRTSFEHVPVIWSYDVAFEERDSSTIVMATPYPVTQDRAGFVSVHGERRWAESFEGLDSLLGS